MTPRLAARLLHFMGWGFIIFGIVFVTIAFSGYAGFAHRLTNIFDWSGVAHTETLTRNARWFAAIMSGLSAGFGALYVFVVAPLLTLPNLESQKIAKRGGLIGAFTWFIVDSAGSFAAGVPSNVAMNVIFLMALTLPLMMVSTSDES